MLVALTLAAAGYLAEAGIAQLADDSKCRQRQQRSRPVRCLAACRAASWSAWRTMRGAARQTAAATGRRGSTKRRSTSTRRAKTRSGTSPAGMSACRRPPGSLGQSRQQRSLQRRPEGPQRSRCRAARCTSAAVLPMSLQRSKRQRRPSVQPRPSCGRTRRSASTARATLINPGQTHQLDLRLLYPPASHQWRCCPCAWSQRSQ